MKKCSICKKPAIWQREFKKDEDKEQYLCEECLMAKDNPSLYIDAYKYCGK